MITQGQVQDYKKAYNHLIVRYKKAEKYLNDNNIPLATREKHLDEFKKIIQALNEAMETFRKYGIKMTSLEITEGFARL